MTIRTFPMIGQWRMCVRNDETHPTSIDAYLAQLDTLVLKVCITRRVVLVALSCAQAAALAFLRVQRA